MIETRSATMTTAASLSTDPAPDGAPSPRTTREARFWDRMAQGYARRPVADQAAYEAKLATMRALLDATPGARVVEIGCGTGSTAIALAPHAGRIRATDLSPAMIAIAREKAREAGAAGVDFEVAALEALDIAAGSQDVVMAHSILHLAHDRDAAIGAAWDWLRPGGAFVSSTVCLAEHAPWARPIAWSARMAGVFPHRLGFFTEAQLRGAIEARGFVIERRFRPSRKAAVFFVARKPA
jgi:ubiquinone/menaquinone biosynthesis C-methylase UbiE